MNNFDDAAIAADYDERKIDEFADAMKAKMAKKRHEGRGGWDDPAQCSVDYLADLLLSHIAKGDPVDIANFCMMLFHRGGSEAIRHAAGDLSTPMLTESEAIEAAAKNMYALKPEPVHGGALSRGVAWEKASIRARNKWRLNAKQAVVAISAAGIRFKD